MFQNYKINNNMTTTELLKEVLKDKIFQEKYGISQEELESISFDADSGYPVVEAIKTIIKLKDSSTPDVNVYKNIKQNIFNISE